MTTKVTWEGAMWSCLQHNKPNRGLLTICNLREHIQAVAFIEDKFRSNPGKCTAYYRAVVN